MGDSRVLERCDRIGVVLGGATAHVRPLRDLVELAEGESEIATGIVADAIAPRILPNIDIIPWRDTHVIAVHIHPGPSRPYQVIAAGAEEGVYVRVGSTNRRADTQLVAELAGTARNESFDEQPMPDLGADAIDRTAVRAAFADIREVRARDLRTLHLTTGHQGREVPTVGGVLLFGAERLDHFLDAWVQAGRFRGASKSAIVDSADIRAYPAEAIRHALAFVTRNTALSFELTGDARRIEVPEYPPEAVREAVINAVVHADYFQHGAPIRIALFDDRLEVESPGLLVPELTIPDLLGGVSKVRNHVIARVFRELGLIEQWGSGIGRMHEACRAAGMTPPLLEEVCTHFRVTLLSARDAAPEVNDVDTATLDALRAAEGLTTSAVAAHIGRTPRATRNRLRRLVERGLVVELGSEPNDPQRRYYVAKEPGRHGR